MAGLFQRCCRNGAPRMVCGRRALLATAGALAACGRTATLRADSTKLKIVVVGGHPGDPEYGCGGTIARYTALGHDVTLLYLNRGQAENSGPPDCRENDASGGSAVRVREAEAACGILGAHARFAGQCNGHAVVDPSHYNQFTLVLRDLAPDVVFNQWPIDNHPDHRACSSLTYEAWIRMGREPAMYYYEVSDGEDTEMFTPSDYVDITAMATLKRRACYAHASQNPDKYYDLQSRITHFRGVQAGCVQAEAFVRHVDSWPGLLP